ncbi:HTR-like protein [Halobacteriales archaeon QS_4_62_28]|nr:MAG: HTR-like protein [Halobacteriales archaeon QS_4_62_28]
MARTAQKVDSLAAEGEDMTDALGTVLSVAQRNGTVSWADVSDDLTSGQWGRLIEKGLLVDADGAGFVIDDPEGIREALEESDPDAISSTTDANDGDEDAEVNWTSYDKAAAVITLGLFAGYMLQSVRSVVGGTLDVLLGPLNDAVPFYVVILILAILTGLWSTILQDNLMNSEVMAQTQGKMQDLKERREAAKERGDDEELEAIQQEQMEAMGDQLGMFKAQFRPMVWIMLLTIPAFLWMYWMIRDGHIEATETVMVLPIFGEISGWQEGVIGPLQAWILWYFLCSLGFSQLLRKALNVQTSPTG